MAAKSTTTTASSTPRRRTSRRRAPRFLWRQDGTQGTEDYDHLILATGSTPISPNVPGKDLKGIHFLKLFQDGQDVDHELSQENVKTVAVIGAGYIGVEIAEAARRRGKQVLLFDASDRSLSTHFDPEFTDLMDHNLVEHGIETHFGELVTEYRGNDQGHVTQVVSKKGEYDADLVINCIGFTANNALGKDHLKLFKNGAYLVDRYGQTSDPAVFAVGDCATIYSNATDEMTYIALASNAVRSGIVAAHNVAGHKVESVGVQGSNGIEIWGLKMVSTGLSKVAAEKAGMDVKVTDYEDLQKPAFMPADQNGEVKIRIVYEANSRRVVGAQLASKEDISMAIHMFSLAIQEHLTIDRLSQLDIFFLPHFNQPYNYITMAALNAK